MKLKACITLLTAFIFSIGIASSQDVKNSIINGTKNKVKNKKETVKDNVKDEVKTEVKDEIKGNNNTNAQDTSKTKKKTNSTTTSKNDTLKTDNIAVNEEGEPGEKKDQVKKLIKDNKTTNDTKTDNANTGTGNLTDKDGGSTTKIAVNEEGEAENSGQKKDTKTNTNNNSQVTPK